MAAISSRSLLPNSFRTLRGLAPASSAVARSSSSMLKDDEIIPPPIQPPPPPIQPPPPVSWGLAWRQWRLIEALEAFERAFKPSKAELFREADLEELSLLLKKSAVRGFATRSFLQKLVHIVSTMSYDDQEQRLRRFFPMSSSWHLHSNWPQKEKRDDIINSYIKHLATLVGRSLSRPSSASSFVIPSAEVASASFVGLYPPWFVTSLASGHVTSSSKHPNPTCFPKEATDLTGGIDFMEKVPEEDVTLDDISNSDFKTKMVGREEARRKIDLVYKHKPPACVPKGIPTKIKEKEKLVEKIGGCLGERIGSTMSYDDISNSYYIKHRVGSSAVVRSYSLLLQRLRPKGDAAAASVGLYPPRLSLLGRGFATSSSMHLNPNSFMENEASDITGGVDVEKWLVVMEKVPEGDMMTLHDIINSHVKILARVVGSEEEARRKIELVYQQKPQAYVPCAFIANVPKDVATKIKELPEVRSVVPNGSYSKVDLQPLEGAPLGLVFLRSFFISLCVSFTVGCIIVAALLCGFTYYDSLVDEEEEEEKESV